MTTDFDHLSEPERAALDAQLAANERPSWWDSFYTNRARPCPFFVPHPDESLAEYVAKGLIQPGRAIDIGCGNGRNSIYLARHGFSVEGVDYSGTALAWARQWIEQAGVTVRLRQANVLEVDLGTAQYDLVYDSGCFHHIAPHRRSQYVERVTRALRSDGWLCLTCFRPEGGSGYSDAEVYERRSLGGGLGYTEERLRAIWARDLQVHRLRQMRAQQPSSGLFGESFLWVMLARRT